MSPCGDKQTPRPRPSRVHYSDDQVTLYHGDCRDVLAGMPDASVDAVVTDPPYELGFMGKAWDTSGIAYDPAMWRECLRVLKPGGHLLAFGGTRTYHRMTSAIEDAGFEIRDSIHWIYGSGFPKSLDVSKAIDKAAGAVREVVGSVRTRDLSRHDGEIKGDMLVGVSRGSAAVDLTAPATPEAAAWAGWGTALKPAHEPIVVARKPLAGTVAGNVLAHGTGALNIDGCRVGTTTRTNASKPNVLRVGVSSGMTQGTETVHHDHGRWPTNVVLDEAAAAELDAQSGTSMSRVGKPRGAAPGEGWGMTATGAEYADTGGASRFFPVFRYEPKAPTAERPRVDGTAHATVKPLDLMRWLVRLVTPPGGTVLEPFAGSGTTAEACIVEGFRCIAIEADAAHLPLIKARLAKPIQPVLFADDGEAAS